MEWRTATSSGRKNSHIAQIGALTCIVGSSCHNAWPACMGHPHGSLQQAAAEAAMPVSARGMKLPMQPVPPRGGASVGVGVLPGPPAGTPIPPTMMMEEESAKQGCVTG